MNFKPGSFFRNLVLPLFILGVSLILVTRGFLFLTIDRVAAIWIIWGLLAEGQDFIRGQEGQLILKSTSLTISDQNFLRDNSKGIKRFSAFAPGNGLFLIVMGTFLSVI